MYTGTRVEEEEVEHHVTGWVVHTGYSDTHRLGGDVRYTGYTTQDEGCQGTVYEETLGMGERFIGYRSHSIVFG